MNDSKPAGSAAAALGAHSKDGSESGQPGVASASGGASGGAAQAQGTESHADMAHEARERIERMTNTMRDAAGAARETVVTQGGRAMEQTGRVVREQPLMALAVTGLVCLAVGAMLGRR